MDFSQILQEIESLKNELSDAAKERSELLGKLQSSLEQHYSELEGQYESLRTIQSEAMNRQFDEQNEQIGAFRQTQDSFLREQAAKAESMQKAQDEWIAVLETAQQAAREIAEQVHTQETKIAELRNTAEKGMRFLHDQAKDDREQIDTQLDELRASLTKTDQTKRMEDLQKRLDQLRAESTAFFNNLAGRMEKMKAQLSSVGGVEGKLKDCIDEINSVRSETAKVGKRVARLEESGPIGPGPYRKPKSMLPVIAILLSVIAILGLAAGGILFRLSQADAAVQMREQIEQSQNESAAQLQQLADQVEQLRMIVEATPTPEPAPTATPIATPQPNATGEGAKPNP
ncbi:MAG: hypothetical protein LLF75_00275 [Eubacteriales bacterium]|nr:hypothetical protein [Eubacteriales bacterium]